MTSELEKTRHADAFEEAYQTATGCIAGALHAVNLRKIHASQALGDSHEIVQQYKEELAELSALHRKIIDFDPIAIAEAPSVSAEFYKKYGNKDIGQLNINDHKLAKPHDNGLG